jgi:reverse gyrase
VNPGLGMGKSTFIAFQSIHQACDAKGSVIVVLNSDEVLLYRDYSKVNFIVQQLQQKYMGFNFSVELIDAAV